MSNGKIKTGVIFRILKADGEAVPKDLYAKVLNVVGPVKEYEIGIFSHENDELRTKFKANKQFFELLENQNAILYYTADKLEDFYRTPIPKFSRLKSIMEDED